MRQVWLCTLVGLERMILLPLLFESWGCRYKPPCLASNVLSTEEEIEGLYVTCTVSHCREEAATRYTWRTFRSKSTLSHNTKSSNTWALKGGTEIQRLLQSKDLLVKTPGTDPGGSISMASGEQTACDLEKGADSKDCGTVAGAAGWESHPGMNPWPGPSWLFLWSSLVLGTVWFVCFLRSFEH